MKEFFKPTWSKVIITIILALFWIYYINLSTPIVDCMPCSPGEFEDCTDYHDYLLIKVGCHCGCTSMSTVYSQYLRIVLIPLIISYIISCIIMLIYRKIKK